MFNMVDGIQLKKDKLLGRVAIKKEKNQIIILLTLEMELTSIKVKKTKGHKNIVKLDDKYSMKLKYPSMQQFIDANFV